MLGALFIFLVGALRCPRWLRLTSLVYQLYRIGWQAIPIVMLITFLIGAIYSILPDPRRPLGATAVLHARTTIAVRSVTTADTTAS